MAHIKQSNFPTINRVTEVLRRMDDNSSQSGRNEDLLQGSGYYES